MSTKYKINHLLRYYMMDSFKGLLEVKFMRK